MALIAILKDVTKNATNTTCLTENVSVIFKINGNTLKDESGEIIRVPADNTAVTYTYHIPVGTAGIDMDGNIRNYSVEAVYNNPLFYPDARDTTEYNIERSSVNINFQSVKVQNNKLSIKANFTDYNDNLLVGNNKVCVKINGVTYKENNESKYFTIENGRVNLSNLKLASGTTVKSVMLVTGDRQAYLDARQTTTDITTS